MDREKLTESFTENFFTTMPLIHKKLMRNIINNTLDMSKQQYQLLFVIQHDNGRPMSYYSEKMLISKPNLTVIVDKLLQEGYVERDFDPDDRRVIILKMTDKGEGVVCKTKKKILKHMKKKLEALSDGEITRLNGIFIEMKSIFERLES